MNPEINMKMTGIELTILEKKRTQTDQNGAGQK